jgi:hypothetical protein
MTVQRYMKRYGITIREVIVVARPERVRIDRDELERLVDAGWSFEKIGPMLGCHPTTAARRARARAVLRHRVRASDRPDAVRRDRVPDHVPRLTYYSWQALEPIRWLQVATLSNPLVYLSEGFRTALTPVPHMSLLVVYPALIGFLVLFTYLGIRGFTKRVVA